MEVKNLLLYQLSYRPNYIRLETSTSVNEGDLELTFELSPGPPGRS